MGKIFTAIGGMVLAFLIGFISLYLLMPTVAPTKVEKAQRHLDSLAMVHGYDQGQNPMLVLDSLSTLRSRMDSVLAMRQLIRSSLDNQDTVLVALQDTLRNTRSRLGALTREHSELLSLMDELTARMQVLEGQRVEVENMSKTISKLEDKELKALVQSLDDGTLELLYLEASDRARMSILGALPPDRAALFIKHLVKAPPSHLDADTIGIADAQPAGVLPAGTMPADFAAPPLTSLPGQ